MGLDKQPEISDASPRLFRLFINGAWVETSARDELRSPYDNSLQGYVFQAGAREIDEAVEGCANAFRLTRELSRGERAERLAAFAQAVAQRQEEIARAVTLTTGKPISYSRQEAARAAVVLDLAAEEAKRFGGAFEPLDHDLTRRFALGIVERFPVGPVAAITPFNFPVTLAVHKVGPALAVGNTVVLKPPPQCPQPALVLAECAAKAGFPPGSLNVVCAEPSVAERLVLDERVRMVSFTGSAKVGWALKQLAPRKRFCLEMGGNGGLIIDEDVDVEYAANRAARGAFIHAGQVCTSVQRIFVHRRVYGEFLRHFIAQTEKLKVGDPLDEATIVGPMINEAAAERVMQWIMEAKDSGATILTGARKEGNFVWPTVVEIATKEGHELKPWREEVFGPVVTVERIESFAEGLALVNDSRYGLQAGVFTENLERAFMAFRKLEVGAVIVGDTSLFRVDTYPFGGVKDSGFGREGVRYAMEAMTEPRALILNLRRQA